MVIGDLLASGGFDASSPESREWLVRLLRQEGVNLLEAAPDQLERGTPVYVNGEADVIEVQRLMAQNHIRVLPVLRDGEVVGLVDLVELAMRDDLAPDADIAQVATFEPPTAAP
ncbi:MAG: CBS domain-containing protein [Actinomycetota bacterium]